MPIDKRELLVLSIGSGVLGFCVGILVMLSPIETPPLRLPPRSAEAVRMAATITEARRAGVPWDLALAVSRVEVTNADSMARGRVGEIGYFQVTPSLWATKFPECYPERPLYNPERNACIGVRVLRYQYERSGSWPEALLRYNGSLHFPEPGSRYLKGVARNRLAVNDTSARVEAAP